MMWSFEWLNTQQHLGSSKTALLEAFAHWRYQLFLYQPATYSLSTFILYADGRFQSYDDDKVLVIHSSSVDAVAWLFCDVE